MAYDNCRYPFILSSIYGLNKSFSKFAVVGLGNLNSSPDSFEPTVCICNQDFNGFRFCPESWETLLKKFEDIDAYFRSSGESLEGQVIIIPGFKILFTKAYSEEAIDIIKVEDTEEAESTEPAAKRPRREDGKNFTPHLVFKRVSFESLKLFTKCINSKFEFLKRLAKFPISCIKVLGEIVGNALRDKHQSQALYYSISDIRRVMLDIEESTVVDRIKEELVKDKIEVDENIIKLVLNEILVSYLDCIGLYIEGYIKS